MTFDEARDSLLMEIEIEQGKLTKYTSDPEWTNYAARDFNEMRESVTGLYKQLCKLNEAEQLARNRAKGGT